LCSQGKSEAVQALIDAGVNVHQAHKDGWNALTHVKDEETIKVLKKAGLGKQSEL
jgi:hypothetical protein